MLRVLPKSFYAVLILILLAANVCVYQTIFAPHVLQISVLDVGKGNSVLIQTPNKKTILIDAGPDASILRAIGTTLPEWQKNIDEIILTGAKTSFTGGLPEVLNKYHVPTPLSFGTASNPYGSQIILDSVSIKIISPATLTISFGDTSLSISSSTPKGVYTSDGKTIIKKD
jgi:beta-lactamase superfamily II metal-dependent hydrolase